VPRQRERERERERREIIYLPSKRQQQSSSVTITTMAVCQRRHMPIKAAWPPIISKLNNNYSY